jgi:hypothetical protein
MVDPIDGRFSRFVSGIEGLGDWSGGSHGELAIRQKEKIQPDRMIRNPTAWPEAFMIHWVNQNA